jgi:hypothetical protein
MPAFNLRLRATLGEGTRTGEGGMGGRRCRREETDVVVHLLPSIAGVQIQGVEGKPGFVEACLTRCGLRHAREEARTPPLPPGTRRRQEVPRACLVAFPAPS